MHKHRLTWPGVLLLPLLPPAPPQIDKAFKPKVGVEWAPGYHGTLYNLTDDAIQVQAYLLLPLFGLRPCPHVDANIATGFQQVPHGVKQKHSSCWLLCGGPGIHNSSALATGPPRPGVPALHPLAGGDQRR